MITTVRCIHTESISNFIAGRILKVIVFSSCMLLLLMLSSCTGSNPVHKEDSPAAGQIFASNYSIIFVIHGDGDYLVHDSNGDEYTADEAALSEAKITAQLNSKGSIFIFHQKRKSNVLWFFPACDGEFYYYYNGRLAAHEEYWRDWKQNPYEAELELYRRFHGESQSELLSIFMYYGHEIPESGGKGYDASYPERSFTVMDLGRVLKEFTRNTAKFDLVSLSTCYGGTPFTIGAVAPHAKFIVASPENLHLSYFNSCSLDRLDTTALQNGIASFAKIFAEQAFTRLTRDVQTNVSVAVYEVNRVQEYLDTVRTMYIRTLNQSRDEQNAAFEHCDCADLPEFRTEGMAEGVEVYYRPARFGRSKNVKKHSGWECIRSREGESERK